LLACLLCIGLVDGLYGQLQPADLLLVVNQDSPTSVYVANLYRRYYPAITDDQIVHLYGLPDASLSPAEEIIDRETFEQQIAAPIRQHLLNKGRVNSTKAIVTTAGMPYRIEDTSYPNVIVPGGCTVYPSSSITYVNAASVESELAVLFQIDPDSPNPAPLNNRWVNPYQGYRNCSIDQFERDILSNRENMTWFRPLVTGVTYKSAVMEGSYNGYGVENRHFSAGDIYLTCRLDGPKQQERNNAVFAVRDMLERSRRAASPEAGINPLQAVAVIDNVPSSSLDYNRIVNLETGTLYNECSPGGPSAPDITFPEIRSDYPSAYFQMTGVYPDEDTATVGLMSAGHGLTVIHNDYPNDQWDQSDLAGYQALVALATYGSHDDAGSSSDYLVAGGPGGGPLFCMTYGAVFTAIESFNAVTFFSDVPGGQGKITDFLAIGGSGAIGHAFEPISDAIVDNEFLMYNLLADEDGDGRGDLTFAEAAFTALPYLSWSEVVLGDPLMRIMYSVGGVACAKPLTGDVDLDGVVTNYDLYLITRVTGSSFGDGIYDDAADINRDGDITSYDIWLAADNIGGTDPNAFGVEASGS